LVVPSRDNGRSGPERKFAHPPLTVRFRIRISRRRIRRAAREARILRISPFHAAISRTL
jgi:hypothetical protein